MVSLDAVGTGDTGSIAMPHLGQFSGRSLNTSRCIGQEYFLAVTVCEDGLVAMAVPPCEPPQQEG